MRRLLNVLKPRARYQRFHQRALPKMPPVWAHIATSARDDVYRALCPTLGRNDSLSDEERAGYVHEDD